MIRIQGHLMRVAIIVTVMMAVLWPFMAQMDAVEWTAICGAIVILIVAAIMWEV